MYSQNAFLYIFSNIESSVNDQLSNSAQAILVPNLSLNNNHLPTTTSSYLKLVQNEEITV